MVPEGRTVECEIASKRVRVGGLVSIGASFGADGDPVTSRETFLHLMPDTPQGQHRDGTDSSAAWRPTRPVARRRRVSFCRRM